MKTYQPKGREIDRKKHVIEAEGKVLGRVATQVAGYLVGKQKTIYTPHLDVGDFVMVKNASKVELTRKKEQKKTYRSHSGFPGGYKEVAFLKLKKEQPAKVIQKAVKGMLPKNRLQRKRM